MTALDGLPTGLGPHLRRELARRQIARPAAPLRVLVVGDLQYQSEFIFGVHQGFTLLGHWVSVMDVRSELGAIAAKARAVAPQLAFMHMLMWSPMGSRHTAGLLELCTQWRERGTRVVIHDGDARPAPRYPHDISPAVDLALCNHTADRSAWRIPTLQWPYFAFAQQAPAARLDLFRCRLAFAGRQGPGLYAARTILLAQLRAQLGSGLKVFPSPEVPHTLFRTPEVAASADAVLGHARPETWECGWKDVRYWMYPGAAGVLLHDDDTGPLVPGEHFVLYQSDDVTSVLEALDVARDKGPRIRRQAFAYVQAEHTSVNRARAVLEALCR